MGSKLLTMMAMFDAATAGDPLKTHFKQTTEKKAKKINCRTCGKPFKSKDTLTCSRECFLEHKKKMQSK